MIDAITTNETRFFREPRQFEFFVQDVFPRWRVEANHGLRPKRVRIWSAGCSSGEEPYTLAMLLAQHLPAEEGWDTHILATDISHRMLERARKGIYDFARGEDIPKELLRRFMLRGFADQQGRIKVKAALQEMVEFRLLNLNQRPYAVESPYDAIFCRNVLIYFSSDSRQRAVSNLVNHLGSEGFLFVGHAENLSSLSPQLRSVEPTIYLKKDSDSKAYLPNDSSKTLSDAERQKAIGTSASR
jgi:chemotaxis protein methyltransferase CheR